MSVLSEILEKTVQLNASDLHITCGQSPCYRVSGEIAIEDTEPLEEDTVYAIIEESAPDHLRGKFQQLRELDYSTSLEGIGRFRINAFMTRHGPAIAIRHVKSEIPAAADLNLPQLINKLAESRRGIVFITGSTGSGKSSTLAAMIGHLNQHFSKRIITLEDPVEYVFNDINSVISQREIGLDTASFHEGLKRVLRQDPDVIMIGEMRDMESFSAALSAAETGHLVLSTLHTSNASQSIGRILDFAPANERDQFRKALSENLVAVMAQRLLHATSDNLVPAVELMLNTPTIRKLIYENELSKLTHAIETDKESGMKTFDQSIHDLIVDGKITEETGLENASNPQALQMMLKGISHGASRGIL